MSNSGMKNKVPLWAIIASACVAIAIAVVIFMKSGGGSPLPPDYDPKAPPGTKIFAPAGYNIPKEPAPPAPPSGVSATPPGPGSSSKPPGAPK